MKRNEMKQLLEIGEYVRIEMHDGDRPDMRVHTVVSGFVRALSNAGIRVDVRKYDGRDVEPRDKIYTWKSSNITEITPMLAPVSA